MSFIDTVQEVKRLSKDMHDEEEQRREAATKKGERSNLSFILEKDGPKTEAFRAYVEKLDSRTLNNLVAVMYAGRDQVKLFDALNRQKGFTDEECITKLEEKIPLPLYLEMGVAQARKEGIPLTTL